MEPDVSDLAENVANGLPKTATPPLRMSVADAAPVEDVFIDHRRLVQWVLGNDGYFHSDAQIAFSQRKGHHLVVTEGATLSNNTRIASCPMPVTLSVLNALSIDPFSNRGVEFPMSFLRSQSKNPESLQAFYLMEQLIRGSASWWAPYIASLPTVEDVTAMQFEEEADIMWLKGTNLRGGISTQAAKWKDMYLRGSGQLRDLGWSNALDGSYTWPKFRWAASIFGSRSFTSQVLDSTLPADLARLGQRPRDDQPYDLVTLFSDRFGVLLPLLDLLNHRPGAKIEWQARYNFIGLQILESYSPNQELCNNYGPRDNEGLLLAYGFTLENNPFDHLVISVKAPPGSPLDAARTAWKQDFRSDPERRCFIFDFKHPEATSAVALETSLFSFDLLDSISILCANEREMQSMNMRSQSLMSFCLSKSPKFEDGRIILATLCQLSRECSARAQRLRSTDPARGDRLLEPANRKQCNAKVYRDGQLAIVETAAALCNFVLRSAISGATDGEDTLVSLQKQISNTTLGNLRTLVDGHQSRLTRPLELLDCDALVGMTPNSDRVRRCLSELGNLLRSGANDKTEAAASSSSGGGTSGITKFEHSSDTTARASSSFSKSLLAVALSILYSEYSHGVKLPHRVTEWIKQLVAWYPVDPTSWAYVPTPGPWAPGEEAPADLMSLLAARATMSPVMPVDSAVKRWLRPERICWGWNVMEEEKVSVPAYIIAQHGTAGSEPTGEFLLIYCPRY